MAGTTTWTDQHRQRSWNTHMQVHLSIQRHAFVHEEVPQPSLDSVPHHVRGMDWMEGENPWDVEHGTHPKHVQAKASFQSRELM